MGDLLVFWGTHHHARLSFNLTIGSEIIPHVIAFGDSIFDNRVYVAPEPDVMHQQRDELGTGFTATLLAVDGHVTDDVCERQLPRLPADASHLVLSVGGNDALGCASALRERAGSVGEAVAMLDAGREPFRRDYQTTLDAISAADLPLAVCTIYDGNYSGPEGRVIAAALSLFNDVITREAFARGCQPIDLRLICDRPEDYANPIEPSARGGAKVTAAIAATLRATPAPANRSTVCAHG